MSNILSRLAKSMDGEFRPSNPDEYFILRLARGLGEPEAANHYALLTSQYSDSKLLSAYRKAVAARHPQPARIFHDCLAANGGNGNGVPRPRLMAVRIERRAVAVAVFAGTHVEGWRVRQLSSDPRRAETTISGFIRSVLGEHDCGSIALEAISGEIVRSTLHRIVVEQCREMGISVWEVPRQSVIRALAYPPPKSRESVRELMLRIWPLPSLRQSQTCVLDAFAVGLYVQTERLFADDFSP